MKRICIYILPIISGLLLAACNNGEVNNKYCNLRARLTIDNVLQAPVLFTACESMGEYCTIKSDGQRFTFTNASNTTSVINIPAISDYNGYYWLIGKTESQVVCFDLACSNCYENYGITKPLRLQVGGYAKCNSCGRTYNLNDCGTIADRPGGRNLYRYRVSYIGNTLVINNGI